MPSLHWYTKDNNLTDSSYIVNVLDGRVENELIIGRLDRKNFDQKFECRAVLNETVLLSTFVVIDLNRKFVDFFYILLFVTYRLLKEFSY